MIEIMVGDLVVNKTNSKYKFIVLSIKNESNNLLFNKKYIKVFNCTRLNNKGTGNIYITFFECEIEKVNKI